MSTNGGLNHKKALAGKYLLEGMTLKQALIKAGYSPSTARNPKSKKLGAAVCLAEAKKLDPEADPVKLVVSARNLFLKKLEDAQKDPTTVSLTAAARSAETAERYYAAGDRREEPSPRTFAERVEWIASVVEELRRRKAAKGENLTIDLKPIGDLPTVDKTSTT